MVSVSVVEQWFSAVSSQNQKWCCKTGSRVVAALAWCYVKDRQAPASCVCTASLMEINSAVLVWHFIWHT